jgi:hypothetical protein
MHLVGLFGMFGIEHGSLSGLIVVVLGLPWIMIVDELPVPILPWVAAVLPAINYLLLWNLCRARRHEY